MAFGISSREIAKDRLPDFREMLVTARVDQVVYRYFLNQAGKEIEPVGCQANRFSQTGYEGITQ